MRLLFVCHSLPPLGRPLANVGGMQRAAVELHDALLAHPEVALVPCVLRSAWHERHWRVPLFLGQALREVRRRVRRGEVDAVLFSSMVTATLALPLRAELARRGVPCATITYGLDVTTPIAPWQWMVRRVFGVVDGVLPISRATAEACLARGLPPARCTVVPLGVDARRFTAVPQGDAADVASHIAARAAARAALVASLGDPSHPLPPDALLLCSVGRHVRRKGFEWFVASVMPQLPPDVHYWLAGSGPETERIRAAVAAHGLHDRVRLLGGVSEEALALLYRGADLFVMPNVPVPGDMEGFGLVMLEAGLCGLPSIAARLEGITDVITPGANGELVPSGDAGAFAAAIRRRRDDRAALADESARAVRHTAATFGWRAAADRYLAAMRGLQRPTRAPGGTADLRR